MAASALKVVFENDNFFAVDKPAGWLSVPGRTGSDDPRPCLAVEVRRLNADVLPIHRLDVEVTGLVLFAKNAEAHRAANGWFETRTVEKFYDAWTEGARPPSGGPLLYESRIARGKKRAFEAPHGKPASTRVTWLSERPLSSGASAQLWSVQPLTGRSHQIRFELARHGNPVLGDALYGAREPWREGEIALRAVKLVFSDEARALGLPANLEVGGLAP